MSNELDLTTTYIPNIAQQLSIGRPILFLGAGFSMDAKNLAGEHLMSGAALTKKLWEFRYPGDDYDTTTELKDIYEAARLLDPKRLSTMLRNDFSVDFKSCPGWYEKFLSMPWHKIYTLNIDDLVEVVLQNGSSSRSYKSISATSSNAVDSGDSCLQVVHLNGTMDDLPDNVVFSRLQYSNNLNNERAYELLRADILHRPIIYVGTGVDEPLLWKYIEMRSSLESGQKELRPRSYLITPSLNKSKLPLLESYNVAWIDMTGGQFYEEVLAKTGDAKSKGLSYIGALSNTAPVDPEAFELVGELIQQTSKTEEYFEYLMGAKPIWKDLIDNRIADRHCYEEFHQHIQSVRSSSSGCKHIVLTGTAGSGKTSALMAAAARLEADGLPVAWIDANVQYSIRGFKKALIANESLGALFIDDADIYGSTLSTMISIALEVNPRLIIVSEIRSNKVDSVIDKVQLSDFEQIEYTIPHLVDEDIDSILDVLDRENRLGALKGKSRDQRRTIFEKFCGRQLLVAMYTATHGKRFEEKIEDELEDMNGLKKAIYGTICVASAYRLYLRNEDIAIAFSEHGNQWLGELTKLNERKLVLRKQYDSYSGRHRVIDQCVLDSLQRSGKIYQITRSLIKIGASKTTPSTVKSSQRYRLLRVFTNHNYIKRAMGLEKGRQIYAQFEEMLEWSAHYWLHRGALELEVGDFDRAEVFLENARGIDGDSVFIDTEIAYLNLKKALANPRSVELRNVVDESIHTLDDICRRKPSQSPHAYHILGNFALEWINEGIDDPREKNRFLTSVKGKVESAKKYEDGGDYLDPLLANLTRRILQLAVRSQPS